jgi:hypothetical protein
MVLISRLERGVMSSKNKGQYVVYERASRDEESFFLIMAKQVASEAKEPRNWRRKIDPKKHRGGKPVEYGFKQMLLVLLLMVYHRKEYREMEAHLKNNPNLLNELGLKKAPSKSSIQRAAAKIGIATLVEINDTITDRFKKIMDLRERRM